MTGVSAQDMARPNLSRTVAAVAIVAAVCFACNQFRLASNRYGSGKPWSPLSGVFGHVAQGNGGDDSVWINQGIKDAIRSGKKEYVLPSGDISVMNPIVVPGGLHGFTLKGAGSDQTTIHTPNPKLREAITFGADVQLHNNWGLTNQPTAQVQTASAGSNEITLSGDFPIHVGGTYVIWDQWLLHPSTTNVARIMNRAEIVKVKAYDSRARKVTVDVPLGRDYLAAPQLSDVSRSISTDVTIRDIGFNGQVGGTASGGLVNISMADGATLSNLKVTNFIGAGVSVTNCRSVTMDHIAVSGAFSKAAGAGYAVLITRDRFVKATNIDSRDSRHGVIIHGGSMDVDVENCTSEDGGDFDTHGMDERRITFRNDSSKQGVGIGNGAWWGGGQDFTVDHCTFGAEFLGAAVQRVHFIDSELGPVTPMSATSQQTEYGAGYADQIDFKNCTITGENDLIKETPFAGSISFNNCKFVATRTTWGNVIGLKSMKVNLAFNTCDFIGHSGRAFDALIQIANPDPDVKITIQNCRFISEGASSRAVRIAEGALGTIKLENNVFAAGASRGEFLENKGSTPVANDQNRVVSGTGG